MRLSMGYGSLAAPYCKRCPALSVTTEAGTRTRMLNPMLSGMEPSQTRSPCPTNAATVATNLRARHVRAIFFGPA